MRETGLLFTDFGAWLTLHRVDVLVVAMAFAALDLVYLRFRTRRPADLHETAANVSIFGVCTLLRAALLPLRWWAFTCVHRLAPHPLPVDVAHAAVCYLLVDLTLYGLHRALHETRLGWAMHSVHHSSEQYELSLGGRVSWLQRAFDDVFYLPLLLLGFDPLMLLGMIQLNRFSQFWTHTEMIGRLPVLDGFLNTPSNHRVHHTRSAGGRTANYGSNFVIWDRLFGTYRAERGPVAYGAEGLRPGKNPLRIQLAGLVALVRRGR